MALRSRELGLFALLGTSAFLIQGRIYELLIVPRLPEIPKVPLSWWVGEFIPPLLVFLYAGWRGSSASRAFLLATAAFLPWLMAFSIYAAIAGIPVGHDLSVADLQFWTGMSVQFVFWLLVSFAGVAAKYVQRRALAA